MSGTIPPIPPPFGTSFGNPSSPNVNRVDTMSTTTKPINTMTTTNVSQSIVDENLPQLLDSRGGSHVTNVLDFDEEDFTSWNVRFLIFLDRLEPYLLKTLDDGPFVPIDSDVEEDQSINNEFMADLTAEYHERALLENQKRFYKRPDRVGSARKPLDKTKETYFACGKLDYKGKYKGLKAKLAVLTKRIDDLTKEKCEKGKKKKEKREKCLLVESFDWDDESVSSDDEENTKIRAFMAIAEDEPSFGKVDARSGQWFDITMKKVHRLLSMTDGD
nr:hypothetical protein [Tanacetum cinerariifolium]